MTKMPNCIILSCDNMLVSQALRLAKTFSGMPGYWGIKGNDLIDELLTHDNPREAIGQFKSHGGFMVDMKLHDIPNTVKNRARKLIQFANIITVHALGGEAMIRAAVEGAVSGGGTGGNIAGVTILTSHDEQSLEKIGIRIEHGIGGRVLELAQQTAGAGAGGIVCSPKELPLLKKLNLMKIVPGIRMPGKDTQDQKRVDSPGKTIAAGADLLVVGRPIIEASNPVAAFNEMIEDIRSTQNTRA